MLQLKRIFFCDDLENRGKNEKNSGQLAVYTLGRGSGSVVIPGNKYARTVEYAI
jgi:hypothetical protein